MALLAANAVSVVGNQLTLLAIPWFVLQSTGSAAKTGLVAFFGTLPLFIAGFFGGTLVDRLGFKRASILADLASGMAVALVPLLYRTIGLAFWQLLTLVFLRTLFDTPGFTARQSLLPDLVNAAGMPLERANAAYQAIQQLATLLGPPSAGLLIVAMGTSNVLWLDAASFIVSAGLVALGIPPVSRVSQTEDRAQRSYLAELLDSLRFIRRNRLVRAIVSVVALVNFLISPLLAVVLPVYANQIFGSAVDLGLIFAGFGAGGLAGAALYGAIGRHLPRRATFIGAFLIAGIPLWVLAATPPVLVTVGALALLGVASGPINPLLMTITQERVPADLRGRLFGMLFAVGFVGQAPGMLLAGYLLTVIHLQATLVAIALAYLAVTISLLINPAFHEMDRPVAAADGA